MSSDSVVHFVIAAFTVIGQMWWLCFRLFSVKTFVVVVLFVIRFWEAWWTRATTAVVRCTSAVVRNSTSWWISAGIHSNSPYHLIYSKINIKRDGNNCFSYLIRIWSYNCVKSSNIFFLMKIKDLSGHLETSLCNMNHCIFQASWRSWFQAHRSGMGRLHSITGTCWRHRWFHEKSAWRVLCRWPWETSTSIGESVCYSAREWCGNIKA